MKTSAKPSSSRSHGSGGSAGPGAVTTARETSSRLPPAPASRPANRPAAHASRYVSRERRTSSVSSFLAAWSSSTGASLPRFWAKATSACSRSTRARPSSSSGPASAAASSPRDTSNAPAPRLACAAASARSARRAGSPVSATERCSSAAAAARPPRACARLAESSSSRATSSSGPAAAAARCQARRSGSTLRLVTSASAEWAARRSGPPADRYTADRAKGWRKITRSSRASNPSVASTAEGAIPRWSQARRRSSGSPTGSAAATSNSRRVSSGRVSSRRM